MCCQGSPAQPQHVHFFFEAEICCSQNYSQWHLGGRSCRSSGLPRPSRQRTHRLTPMACSHQRHAPPCSVHPAHCSPQGSHVAGQLSEPRVRDRCTHPWRCCSALIGRSCVYRSVAPTDSAPAPKNGRALDLANESPRIDALTLTVLRKLLEA